MMRDIEHILMELINALEVMLVHTQLRQQKEVTNERICDKVPA